MSLHQQTEAFLGMLAAANAQPFHTLPPVQARQAFLQLATLVPAGNAKPAAKIDRSIDGPNGPIALHIYTPEGDTPLPILVFFHGGDFVIGDLDVYDSTCGDLCVGAGRIVVAVDYRLAPEHKFPTGANSAIDQGREALTQATSWLRQKL